MGLVLIIGDSRESVIRHILRCAADVVDFRYIDLAEYYACGEIRRLPNGSEIGLSVNVVRIEDFDGVYQRLVPPALTGDPEEDKRRRGRFIALERVLSSTPIRVVNVPGTGWDNTSKPMQSAALGRFGFNVPPFLSTSMAGEARRFAAERRLIYKSNSSHRSVVNFFDHRDEKDLEHLHECPVMFQGAAIGYDVRVHVVGDQTFAVRIDSDAVDYRYYRRQGTFAQQRRGDISEELSRACIESVRGRGLILAGIDFKVDANGAWWCLEINPMPSFESYDVTLDGMIARAVLAILVEGVEKRVV
jgi:hypothetical protein